jgi:hypothetical protein
VNAFVDWCLHSEGAKEGDSEQEKARKEEARKKECYEQHQEKEPALYNGYCGARWGQGQKARRCKAICWARQAERYAACLARQTPPEPCNPFAMQL